MARDCVAPGFAWALGVVTRPVPVGVCPLLATAGAAYGQAAADTARPDGLSQPWLWIALLLVSVVLLAAAIVML